MSAAGPGPAGGTEPRAERDGPRPATVGVVLALGVLAMSTGALFVRLADAPSLAIAAWRCALATLALAPFAGRAALRGLAAADARALVATGVAGAFLALHFATWITSLAYTSVAASVLLVSTTPLWVALASPFVTGDRFERRTLAGIACALAGSAVLVLGESGAAGERGLLGDGLALAGAVGAAGYVLCGRVARRSLALSAYLLACYGTAALLLLAAAALAGVRLTGFSAPTWTWIACAALVPQLLGHSASAWALRSLSAPRVALANLGEPVAAALLAWLLLDEAVPPAAAGGGALVLAGIALAALRRPGRPVPRERAASGGRGERDRGGRSA